MSGAVIMQLTLELSDSLGNGIDRYGKARVRALLVEAVGRLLKWPPGWRTPRQR